jgi:hypothetical protein
MPAKLSCNEGKSAFVGCGISGNEGVFVGWGASDNVGMTVQAVRSKLINSVTKNMPIDLFIAAVVSSSLYAKLITQQKTTINF